jgi:hypothetical protein
MEKYLLFESSPTNIPSFRPSNVPSPYPYTASSYMETSQGVNPREAIT